MINMDYERMMEKLNGLENKISNAAYNTIDFYDLDALRQGIYVLVLIGMKK